MPMIKGFFFIIINDTDLYIRKLTATFVFQEFKRWKKHNNGNFICVFVCTIVNLATYRQFTNAAWDWIIKKKKTIKNK